MIASGAGDRPALVPYVVYLLIAVNVLVFVQETRAADIDALIDGFATIPFDITNNVVLAPPSPPVPAFTILSAMFLHAGVLHLASNMPFLFAF